MAKTEPDYATFSIHGKVTLHQHIKLLNLLFFSEKKRAHKKNW